MTDVADVDDLLSEWFDWEPISGRLKSVQRAVRKKELLVAETDSRVVGFIHYVLHEDIIDGGPNAFISAFYVSKAERGKGVGTLLLEQAITNSLARGAVGVETSTIHKRAKQLYERPNWPQVVQGFQLPYLLPDRLTTHLERYLLAQFRQSFCSCSESFDITIPSVTRDATMFLPSR